ncbi:MAG TPA: NAD-dependent epimerase/dehydratase family protein [Candidatus Koribacter sp.]|jgi:nucleoside-diphosphate-sugar epimerase
MSEHPAVIVTGVAGNLGRRLLLQLQNFKVIGIDLRPPEGSSLAHFEEMDFGTEASCERLIEVLRETGATSVVHLAFVLDPLQTGILDVERMWQINVAGVARVMEAISVVNRLGGNVQRFIFTSSVSAYGPETPPMVKEDAPLNAHTLNYAVHKKQADEVVRYRQDWMGDCHSYVLRPHIFTGSTVHNYQIGALHGTPTGNSKRAEKMRRDGKRLPLMLPWGKQYLGRQFQFVHVDDVARLVTYLLRRDPALDEPLTVLNVSGHGAPLTIAQCAQMANAKIRRVPNRRVAGLILQKLWDWGISGIPPDALPYMIGSYTMDTTRLQRFLGPEYHDVIRYSVSEALAESFARAAAAGSQD